MATSMTHLAPLTWRGFCLAAPAPSAGSLPMPVGCPALTQRRPWAGYLELRAAGEDPAAGKGLRRMPAATRRGLLVRFSGGLAVLTHQ